MSVTFLLLQRKRILDVMTNVCLMFPVNALFELKSKSELLFSFHNL